MRQFRVLFKQESQSQCLFQFLHLILASFNDGTVSKCKVLRWILSNQNYVEISSRTHLEIQRSLLEIYKREQGIKKDLQRKYELEKDANSQSYGARMM